MPTLNLGRVGFVNKGTWLISTAYKINDTVIYLGGTYACLTANTGQTPILGGTIYWQEWVSEDTVHKSGIETITGLKTFSLSPVIPTPADGDSSTKAASTAFVASAIPYNINAATAKTTPVDADLIGIVDSAASNVLKKLSWIDLKATLKIYYVYAQITSSVTGITGTTFAGATNIVTAPAISPNGTDYYEIEFYAQTLINTVAGAKTYFMLSRGGADMGIIGGGAAPSSLGPNNYCKQVMVLPSGTNIIYSIVAYVSSGSGTVAAGTGGAGNNMTTFLKITKL